MGDVKILIKPGDFPGIFYENKNDDRAKIIDRLRHLEKIKKATGEEVFVIMVDNDHPDWAIYERTIRIRQLDGTLRNFSSYTLLSPESERALRQVAKKPDPVEPMGWQK